MRQHRIRSLVAIVALALALGALIPFLSATRSASANSASGEPAGSNIAIGHTATSDSQQSSQPASNGNDGDATTYYCPTDGNAGHWWEVDLATYANLTGAGVNFGVSQAYQYKIEVSRDNTNWHLVADKTANTSSNAYQYDT